MGWRSMIVAEGSAARLPWHPWEEWKIREEGRLGGMSQKATVPVGTLAIAHSYNQWFDALIKLYVRGCTHRFPGCQQHCSLSKCVAHADGVHGRLDVAHCVVDGKCFCLITQLPRSFLQILVCKEIFNAFGHSSSPNGSKSFGGRPPPTTCLRNSPPRLCY